MERRPGGRYRLAKESFGGSEVRHPKGFTLIELLIVIAIILILIAIALPNFIEAQVRSKVTKAKAELRTIGIAQEMYRTDWNSFTDRATGANSLGALRGWFQLTTPVAYITGYITDPWPSSGAKALFSGQPPYEFSTGSFSTGPEGVDAWPREAFIGATFGPDQNDDSGLGNFPRSGGVPYSATNGTYSNGDIQHLITPRRLINFEHDIDYNPPF